MTTIPAAADPAPTAAAEQTTPTEPPPLAAPDERARLDYATPWPKHAWAASDRAQRLFWQGVRKFVFAGGLGLLVYAIASVAGGVNRHAAPVAAAWGMAFVALMLPAPFRRRRQKKRRRRAASGGGAAAAPTSGI